MNERTAVDKLPCETFFHCFPRSCSLLDLPQLPWLLLFRLLFLLPTLGSFLSGSLPWHPFSPLHHTPLPSASTILSVRKTLNICVSLALSSNTRGTLSTSIQHLHLDVFPAPRICMSETENHIWAPCFSQQYHHPPVAQTHNSRVFISRGLQG